MMPFLFLCYILAYVDRVNVGFAKLQMQQDLGMSDAVYGLGAGIFFLGYFLFEVPANMFMQRIGARLWLGPIMMVWGVVCACHHVRHGRHEFLRPALRAGRGRVRFLPRRDPLPDVLVHAQAPRQDGGHVHDRHPAFRE